MLTGVTQATPVTWALVRRAQAGDNEAIAAIYRRYLPDVRKVVRSRVHDVARADDLVSETFVRALRGLAAVRERSDDIRAWLLTIARNVTLDHFKRASVRLEITAADVPDRPSAWWQPEVEVLRRDRCDVVRALVAKLSPEQRQCVELRFLGELGVGETARAMNRAEGAVRALQYRALRKLADLATPEMSARAA